MSATAVVLGKIGLPAPIKEIAACPWDVIVIGAVHNGLACATYLARAGQRVLVLEGRERVGGACTVEEPFPNVRMSPCAYLAGLLHPLVIEELNLPERGFAGHRRQWPLCAFPDGSSIQLWDDDVRCEEEVRRFSPRDVEGWRAMNVVIRRLRDALRPANGILSDDPHKGQRDLWIGDAPTQEQLDELLAGDPEASSLFSTGRWQSSLNAISPTNACSLPSVGQGVIGTNASPLSAGRGYPFASIILQAASAVCLACGVT